MRLEYIFEVNDLAKDAAAAGLPELTGTAEEIAQAEYIRAELLDSAELFLRESWEQTNGLDDAAVKEHNLQTLHILGQILVQVRLESSAAWWIDHSCGDGACLLRRVYREQRPKEIQV